MGALKSASSRPRVWRLATHIALGFFQDLDIGLPAGEGVVMVECHISDKSMKLCNTGAVILVMPIVFMTIFCNGQ